MSVFKNMKDEANNLKAEIREILKIDRDELYGENRLYKLSQPIIFSLVKTSLRKNWFSFLGIRRIKDIFHEIERYSILVFRVFSDLFVL